MTRREDLQEHVIQQLKAAITENLSEHHVNEHLDTTLIYNHLVKCGFVSITPPSEDPPMMQLLTMDSLRDYKKGSSVKPGNIILNIRKLVEAIPQIISIGAGMVWDNPIVGICGALSLWSKFSDIVTVDITKDQAFVIVALWRNCNFAHEISLDNGFTATNMLLQRKRLITTRGLPLFYPRVVIKRLRSFC